VPQIRKRAAPAPAMGREAELCELFADAARADGWSVYPETAGWDLLLVWTGPDNTVRGPRTGDQVGVEAKLRANVDVLAQAIDRDRYTRPGNPCVNYRAVLVPEATKAFRSVAGALGVVVFTLANCEPWESKKGWRGRRPRVGIQVGAYRASPSKRHWLPPVPLNDSGGRPSPRQMSKWRVGALKLCALLRRRGWITTADFKREGVDPSRWTRARGQNKPPWLIPLRNAAGEPHKHEGRTKYVARDLDSLPDVGYEVEAAALAT